jgi:hypothetical protein
MMEKNLLTWHEGTESTLTADYTDGTESPWCIVLQRDRGPAAHHLDTGVEYGTYALHYGATRISMNLTPERAQELAQYIQDGIDVLEESIAAESTLDDARELLDEVSCLAADARPASSASRPRSSTRALAPARAPRYAVGDEVYNLSPLPGDTAIVEQIMWDGDDVYYSYEGETNTPWWREAALVANESRLRRPRQTHASPEDLGLDPIPRRVLIDERRRLSSALDEEWRAAHKMAHEADPVDQWWGGFAAGVLHVKESLHIRAMVKTARTIGVRTREAVLYDDVVVDPTPSVEVLESAITALTRRRDESKSVDAPPTEP